MHSFFHLIYFAHTFGYADRTYMRVFRYGKGRCAGQTDSIAQRQLPWFVTQSPWFQVMFVCWLAA